MDAVSAGLNIGGRALGALGGLAAERKRNSILRQGIDEQGYYGREANRAVNDLVGSLEQSRPDVAGYTQQFLGALRGMPQVQGVPTASRAFQQGAVAANTSVQGYGRDLASLFARLQAPAQQRRAEGRQMQRTGVRMTDLNQIAASRDFLNKMRANQVEVNPWLKLASGAMQNAGSSGVFGTSDPMAQLSTLEIAPNARTMLPAGW